MPVAGNNTINFTSKRRFQHSIVRWVILYRCEMFCRLHQRDDTPDSLLPRGNFVIGVQKLFAQDTTKFIKNGWGEYECDLPSGCQAQAVKWETTKQAGRDEHVGIKNNAHHLQLDAADLMDEAFDITRLDAQFLSARPTLPLERLPIANPFQMGPGRGPNDFAPGHRFFLSNAVNLFH